MLTRLRKHFARTGSALTRSLTFLRSRALSRRADPAQWGGIPGLNWYATVTRTRGADLREGDWLDTADHSGARMIMGTSGGPVDGQRIVMFHGGDSEIVQVDVRYPVVDPTSLVAPDRVKRVTR